MKKYSNNHNIFIIEKIEFEYINLENLYTKERRIELVQKFNKLPLEGDVFKFYNNKYYFNKNLTSKRKKSMRSILDKLLE